MTKTDLPILEQRRIEAELVRPIWEEMAARLGEEQAAEILGAAIVKHAISMGQAYREGKAGGLAAFHDLLPQWTAGGALEIEMLEQTDSAVSYNVTRCRYAEMYRAMGLGHIGHLLSCNRDGTFCKGFDPAIDLERTQTIMQGAPHCDFRYRYDPATGTPDDG